MGAVTSQRHIGKLLIDLSTRLEHQEQASTNEKKQKMAIWCLWLILLPFQALEEEVSQ